MDPFHFADEPSTFQVKEKQDLLVGETPTGDGPSEILQVAIVENDAQTNILHDEKTAVVDGNGTEEDRLAFINELQNYYAGRGKRFKVPKFYGQPLNCLKLWRVVTKFGGYEQVESSNMWRKVGDAFNPPKTCSNIRWTFRNFYMKILWEYEKHMRQTADYKSAEVICSTANGNKEMNSNPLERRDRSSRTGSKKRIREKSVELPDTVNEFKQLEVPAVDVGLLRAEWVKINARATNTSFEVYVLVPGLQREELRVQALSDGRLIITGEPRDLSDPWGVKPFKKVVQLPGRVDRTQMVAKLHTVGTMCISLPFAKS